MPSQRLARSVEMLLGNGTFRMPQAFPTGDCVKDASDKIESLVRDVARDRKNAFFAAPRRRGIAWGLRCFLDRNLQDQRYQALCLL